ncbi:hypothetical protein SUGI_0634890 [Cryptomeria japonica]|uniref:transcription factor bHLH147 n=1 Tax=Cryptomeria japonica TaxID=3369 RepID=UPI0024148F52|nr:transcription factor bHLH147 [Cryptomeria japonica]GLJ31624.1 hypothetical protein SUGI_0634890 [Cryptomeria japonica]
MHDSGVMALPCNPAWRAGFQKKYLSRFVAELQRRRVERRPSSVKSAADLSLAMAVRGRTAWSRAIIFASASRKANRSTRAWRILKNRRNFHSRLKSLRKSTANACKSTAFCSKQTLAKRPCKPEACSTSSQSLGEEEQSVELRIETLRTLVPGSRGLDTPILLEEVAEYIMALKIQVESMQALANHLENSAVKVSCSARQ